MCKLKDEVLEALSEWHMAQKEFENISPDLIASCSHKIKHKQERYEFLLREYKQHYENGCNCESVVSVGWFEGLCDVVRMAVSKIKSRL